MTLNAPHTKESLCTFLSSCCAFNKFRHDISTVYKKYEMKYTKFIRLAAICMLR